ncbi:MAG: electron transfer flavoprotein subunit beta/FixA family protein [Endomicrobium sp.]|jgi:electron transfer flavoprotein beta subunit|nr:electron transfer flavoprotein subunit beta/FixA family protein [Endomicrobium sp.]
MNKIVICIKHIHNIGINYFDLYALEEGVQLKEQNQDNSKVIVFTMGPRGSESTLRTAISKGADEAYLLTDDKFFKGSDTIATSYILATAIKLLVGQYKIIICGKKTYDSGTEQVGPAIATMLNIPHVSYVREIKSINQRRLTVERVVDDGYETIRSSLPVLLTVTNGVHKPRIASIKSKLLARKANIKIFNAYDLDINTSKIGLYGSPTQVVSLYTKKKKLKKKFSGSARYIVSSFIKQFNNSI